MNKLDYNYGNTPDPTTFRVQASSIANFIDSTTSWYREKLLGEVGFTSSTASVAGTCIHFLCEQFSKNSIISDEDREEVYEYISLQASDTVDPDEVRTMIKPMWKVIKEYLITNPTSLSEPFVEYQTMPGITVGGSIDGIVDLMDPTARYQSLDELPKNHQYKLIDYKTTSSKQPPKTFSRRYDWQLLTYAYVLSKYGITVSQVELIFITKEHIGEISPKTGKRLKSYPSQVTTLSKSITKDDLDFIESIINLITESVDRFVNKPEDRFLLAQDYRLINNTQPLPFLIGEQQEMDI